MAPRIAALAAAVDDVVATPVGDLCVSELQEQIPAVARLVERLSGWVSAAAGQLDAATGGTVPTGQGGGRSVAGWLAEVTCSSPGSAGVRLRVAGRLRGLPLVQAAVLDGVLTLEQAGVLARLVGHLPLADVQSCQEQLIAVAAGRDPGQLSRYVAHLIATHCEPDLDRAEQRAQDARHLVTRTAPDGSVRGRFCLPAGSAETFLTAIEPLARRQGEQDSRSAGQRRADALVELAEQALRHGPLPDHGGARPHLCYLLPADWAARQADRASCPTCSTCPTHRPAGLADTVTASLPGQPGIPAEWASATAAWTGPATRARIETILCDARISRVLLDPVGQVRGLETLTDSVTAAQRRALAARDGRCVARGCTRPPAMCDTHHLIPLADGGPTSIDNLVLLCRRHHVLWHLGKITLRDLQVPWHPDNQRPDSWHPGTGPPRE